MPAFNPWTGSYGGAANNPGNIGYDLSGWNQNIVNQGNTYLVWGTDGLLTKYLVVSFAIKDRIFDIRIEQGAGFTADVILGLDGHDFDVEVVDTNQFPPPTIASGPFAIASPLGVFSVAMVGQSANYARKREGLRTWNFADFTAINLGGTGTIL